MSVSSPKRSDAKTDYWHETFSAVAEAVDPALSRHGLSYRFRSKQEGAKLTLTCILSHRGGYSEETTLEAANDTTGNKNAIQSVGSAATYLQRYTLKLALGLSAAERDDDAAATSNQTEPPFITEDQVIELRDILESYEANEKAFCTAIKVASLAEIYADKYAAAVALIHQKKGQKQ